jgi:hypothetical protein
MLNHFTGELSSNDDYHCLIIAFLLNKVRVSLGILALSVMYVIETASVLSAYSVLSSVLTQKQNKLRGP